MITHLMWQTKHSLLASFDTAVICGLFPVLCTVWHDEHATTNFVAPVLSTHGLTRRESEPFVTVALVPDALGTAMRKLVLVPDVGYTASEPIG